MRMSTLWILVGIPGSGKSTWAKKFVKDKNIFIISRDEIRFSLLEPGDNYFAKEKRVWSEYIKRIQFFLSVGDVIADATHLNEKSREKLLSALDLTYVHVNTVYFDIPLETCLKRNELREGLAKVPPETIQSMRSSLTDPAHDTFYPYNKSITIDPTFSSDFYF